MARLHSLVAVALFGIAGSASAFVFPSPPAGFGGSPGNWTFAPPSGAQQVDSIIRQSQALSVPTSGGTARIPVGFKLKAQAARVAAAAIWAHPATRAAVGIATWLGVARFVWDDVAGIWQKEYDEEMQGTLYSTAAFGQPWYSSFSAACGSRGGTVINGRCMRNSVPGDSVEYPIFTKTGTVVVVKRRPATGEEFEDDLELQPMPQTVPGELPAGTPLPVESPVVNPSPGAQPSPQPYFQPTGNPVPNPSYNPELGPSPTNQPFLQPGVRIVPSPTADAPFRVDMQPVNKPVPTDTPVEPGTDDGESGTKPSEEQLSLCEKHPDILACEKLKLGELGPVELPKRTVPVSIQREEGFGPANGSCPAPKTFVIMGKTMAFRWDLMCDFATGIRPLLIGFAYLSAALAFFGLSRKGD